MRHRTRRASTLLQALAEGKGRVSTLSVARGQVTVTFDARALLYLVDLFLHTIGQTTGLNFYYVEALPVLACRRSALALSTIDFPFHLQRNLASPCT